MELPDTVANILLALTTLDSALPQGAPTSPYLANLLFFREEHKAVSQLKAKGFKYSRLVDDITISKEKIFTPLEKTFVYKTIFQMLKSRHLSINQKKYHISNTETHGKKTVITGLEIENGQVKLPKAKNKRSGGLVYSLQEQAVASGTTSNEYHHIYEHTSGLVSLYSRIDEKKSKSYRSTLRGVRPTFEATRIKKIRHLCNKFINFAHTHPDAREREGYTRKYHRLFHKLSIVRRTNRKTAKELELKLGAVKPKYSTRYFYA